MTDTDTPTLRRFRGVMTWIDANGRRTRNGSISRALLRPQALVLELASAGHSYAVTLHPGEDGRFEGLWTRGQGAQAVSGSALCRLLPCGPFLVQAGHVNMKLEGVWHEDGLWDWVAKLRPLASADPA